MTATTAPVDAAPRRGRTGTAWVLQFMLASQFVAGGVLKVIGDPQMVAMFAEIGVGQWLRIFVGICEVAGAIGLLVPRMARYAAAGLVGLMVGAAVVNVAVLGVSPALPLLYLGVALVVGILRRTTH